MNITVIIPTHNRAALLPRALRSVLAQTSPADEVIIVDDGSTDATQVIMQRDFSDAVYIHQQHKGVSAARNLGIRHARSDWIAFLDSDDEWLPAKLERQRQALTQQSDFKICHSNEIWIRNGRRVNAMRKHEKHGGYIFQHCLPLCVISPSSVIVHRSVFEDIGDFDEEMPACEDYDLWLRLCAKYPVLYLHDNLLQKYGGHSDQLSQRYWGMDRFRIYAMEKLLRQSHLHPSDREATLYMLIKKIGIILDGAKNRGNQELITHYSLKKKVYVHQLAELTDDDVQRQSL